MGLSLRPRPQLGCLREGFLHRTEGQLQQKIRHHEMISEIEEALLLLIFREEPQRIVARPFHTPVPIVIDEPGPSCIRTVLWPIKIQEIPERIPKFVAIQPPEDGPATRAPLPRIK